MRICANLLSFQLFVRQTIDRQIVAANPEVFHCDNSRHGLAGFDEQSNSVRQLKPPPELFSFFALALRLLSGPRAECRALRIAGHEQRRHDAPVAQMDRAAVS
jgi:hypothetical protein